MNKEVFQMQYSELQKIFESFVEKQIEAWKSDIPDHVHELYSSNPQEIAHLVDGMAYSLSAGGKRFRPVLSLMIGNLLDVPKEKVLPWALAVEMIHTYSLIHDDLPCMDDDDERRGQPTNHKVFGEDIALIAGDSLLTHAFEVIATAYDSDSSTAIHLVSALARAAGMHGMIGGQAIDLKAQKKGIGHSELLNLHSLKTGALIASAAQGPAIIAKLGPDKKKPLIEFAKGLGLAFQVADDILDFEPDSPELGNYATVIGLEPTRALLTSITEQAKNQLEPWGEKANVLVGLVDFNFSRKL